MKLDARIKVILSLFFSVIIIGAVLLLSISLSNSGLATNNNLKNLQPSATFIFGTDSLGRDMFVRTIKGLRFSLYVGVIGAAIGVIIAVVFGILSALGSKKIDKIIMFIVDMFIGMPHMIFMILISFALGKGSTGVIVATAITHWPALTRVIRNEVYNIKNAEYIILSKNMGKNRWFIVRKHILPIIFPQIFIGFVLLFPHVILHEASMTFLGFGLSAEKPSIGIILSEAAKHISLGNWWLVVLPGLALIILVKCFDNIGESLRILNNPKTRYL
ncbi:peptide/nickel transport system permease protein [Peptoniphilus asaccharolyticus DSM 20463]|uniref:Peptide/nickel transport system permease protein n=1 Tax=Peptoniphilus asaccharolyticus DSM 20463 TaxID=573058 RepID=A0A1W1V240_PEPAS|nr:ABC transporter permease [Peptoniphilus asaccharolyticus]MBL7576069.1 ABC transporter permease [Peptoniphilus asaccharolyticus]SMB87383.1 peptide/nickel transport system permease protein [Peptoniphilus asaccharolyticus DSM 20463]